MPRTARETTAEIGARIRAARTRAGLSQAQLAQRIGVTTQQIHKYEAGHNRISADRLPALAECLRVPLQELVGAALPATEPAAVRRQALELARVSERLTDAQLAALTTMARSMAAM